MKVKIYYWNWTKTNNHFRSGKKFLLTFLISYGIKGSLSKRTDTKILIIIFKLLDESLIVFCFK
ncbi:hypothetical protein B7R82_05485 [Ligilactobacillus salivarius]|uniref:Uncharacterized protein n=1 Tax=Ligilactobacillus salivarius TaxID=1624 RepID=A0A1Y0F7Y0_9LACO|nr:hypothetical protein B7R82_05485 [Ligilactobacillus salivarius]